MNNLLSDKEIEFMRLSGLILKDVFKKIEKFCVAGKTTLEISNEVEKIIRQNNGIPAFLNYEGFPASACISVNDTLIHGIPGKDILKEGDIVSIDIGAIYNGYYSDACRTFIIGNGSDRAKKIVRVVEECFFNAVSLIKPGVYLGDISHAIEKHALENGFSIPRNFTGHGIGKKLHELPYVFNYGKEKTGIILKKGMCLAIEPMISEGSEKVKFLDDGWTVKMADGKLSAHYENTVLVTDDGYEILTK